MQAGVSTAPVKSPVKKAVTPEIDRKPKKPDVPALPIAEDMLNWSELAFELELDGLARQIVLNSIVHEYTDKRLQLRFLAELQLMIKPDLERQIKQAIEHKLEVSLSLEFQPSPALDCETPHQARLRNLEQERQGVIQAIRQDPVVQQIKAVFGAELVEDSVNKRD